MIINKVTFVTRNSFLEKPKRFFIGSLSLASVTSNKCLTKLRNLQGLQKP
jgi:hypothetical protein